ncbi:hypothetical protein C3F09_00620 [candidate division GN15 bacterium]|uniref:Uncharacterized protein n=1 Tax=candidate division GN15 bacterium TaxID=2072418 RepID=A0A855XC29_9BACT|nr:MAG: hypothetical protein C3F09_00620 [candidate division GN15 bacterium]
MTLVLVGLPITALLAADETKLIGPPLGLKFGMPYSEVATILKGKDIEIDKPKEEKKYKLPDGFKVAKVGKYEVLDRKTDPNLACFNADGELCAFQIVFRWIGDDAPNARKFLDGDLKKAIEGKYSGEGFKKHTDPDIDGNVPEVAFRDEVGNEIGVFYASGISESLLGKMAVSAIWIQYYNEEIVKETRKQQKKTEDL